MGTAIYQIVTDRILARLNAGVVPWRKPWRGGGAAEGSPANLVSNRCYRGANVFLLAGAETPFWLTMHQAEQLGGRVRKGERSSLALFVKYGKHAKGGDDGGGDAEESDDKGGKTWRMLRYYKVFNVSQCEGGNIAALAERRMEIDKAAAGTFDPIRAAEEVVARMPNRPTISHGGGRAYYNPAEDCVGMPHPWRFVDHAKEGREREFYYSTLFHELAHSTAHKSRVGRELGGGFGSKPYAREELVAELAAAMVCESIRMARHPFGETADESAAYIAAWIDKLKSEPRAFLTAASLAQRAADFILRKGGAAEESLAAAAA